MIDFETQEFIGFNRLQQMMDPRLDFTTPFTFYYDETNNIKKFKVRETDFNTSFTGNFVLGGLVHLGVEPDIQQLINSFRLQKTANEVKFAHIATGEFTDCLKSKKLKLFFEFLINNDVYVHYSSLNILYWSIVDIVDSVIVDSEFENLSEQMILKLKNDLYKLCHLEIEAVIDLFFKFEYPNIKGDQVASFIEALIEIFADYIDDSEFHFGIETLRQLLEVSKSKNKLAFVMDEQDHILLEGLAHFYMRPIYTFSNSTHVFDNEDSIKEEISKFRILNNKVEIKNFSFVDSKDDQLIQLSDIFVGIMGKYTQYRNTHTIDQIKADIIETFSPIQLDNLKMFVDIINKSDSRNPAFLHSVDSVEEVQKFGHIAKIISDIPIQM